MSDFRSRLRGLPSFPEQLPSFDPERAGDHPAALFADWLDDAVTHGQLAAHAAVLSTSGERAPSARVLILKDIDDDGWHIATHASSPTGRELTANPAAALTFFWPVRGRQVRVSGPVRRASAERAAADFAARPVGSRAATLVGRQSETLENPRDYEEAEAAAERALDEHPETIDPDWAVFMIDADQVEFWQADQGRRHTRLRYTRNDAGWDRSLLWP